MKLGSLSEDTDVVEALRELRASTVARAHLPNSPSLSENMTTYCSFYMRRARSADPFLSSVTVEAHREGKTSKIQRADGSVGETKFFTSSFEDVSDVREHINFDVEKLYEILRKNAETMISSASQNLIEFMHETVEQTGNTIDGRGKHIHDLALDALEAIPAPEAHESGPSMLVSPAIAAKIKTANQIGMTGAQESRLMSIREKQRIEQVKRKARRKLVG